MLGEYAYSGMEAWSDLGIDQSAFNHKTAEVSMHARAESISWAGVIRETTLNIV